MKTTTIVSVIFLFCMAGIVNAQIKVFNGGNVSIGSTISPVTGCRLQLVGNCIFTENNLSIESAAYIKGLNRFSAANSPDYTWHNNLNTGIFHPATNTICFTINGSEIIRLAPNGNILIGTTTDWGNKLAVNAGNKPALVTFVNHDADWMYSQVTYVNRRTSKALAVIYDDAEKFKVLGNGDVWAFAYYTVSDKELKENIVPITDALEKVMILVGYLTIISQMF